MFAAALSCEAAFYCGQSVSYQFDTDIVVGDGKDNDALR
jgi:hypothetical protein